MRSSDPESDVDPATGAGSSVPVLEDRSPEDRSLEDRSPEQDQGSGSAPGEDSAYWAFYEEVAYRQVQAWAPTVPSRVLDLSGPCAHVARALAGGGHEVLHVQEGPGGPATGAAAAGGRVLSVRADPRQLDWLADASVDAVLAESRMLSRCLATEVTAGDLCRVLRPGGRLLIVVDSLGLGLARLAEQGRWAELADVPNADVVLVPGEGDSITRCFWPEELVAIVQDAGLEVDWVRPRTVLSPAAVERAVARGGRAALAALAASELDLEQERGRDAPGLHLVLSARRPA